MRNRKGMTKKGMTLIEVIISVALLSILVIPIGSLIMSSLRTSKQAENKQNASYIGQKVLEELKSYDEIKLLSGNGGKKYFKLLDGDNIESNSTNQFNASIPMTIYGGTSQQNGKDEDLYTVNINMKKSDKFQYQDSPKKTYNEDLKLEFLNNEDLKLEFLNTGNGTNVINPNPASTTSAKVNGDLIIEVPKNSSGDKRGLIYFKGVPQPVLADAKINRNNILITLDTQYDKDTNVEIINNESDALNIFIVKPDSNSDKLKLKTLKGIVNIYEENEITKNTIGDMYENTVTVTDKNGKQLFSGTSNSNINFVN